jgi:hypothetical protein
MVHETLPQKHPSQKRAGEWLKVKALSSNPKNGKRKKKKRGGRVTSELARGSLR